MKRLLTLLITLSFLLIPSPAFAAEEPLELFPFEFHALASDACFPSASAFVLPGTGTFNEAIPGYRAQLEDAVALAAYQALVDQLAPGVKYVKVDLSGMNLTDWSTEVYPALQAACAAFVFDHPESQYCSISSYGKSGTTAVYVITHREDGQARKDALDAALNTFSESFDTTRPVTEQYRAIHDYVCEIAAYDHEAASSGILSEAHNAFGLLVDRDKVVCEGYSKAFKLLCDRVGLPCLLVAGEATASGKFTGIANHMWNLVQVDGAWFAVDTTWDDIDEYTLSDCPDIAISMTCYDYFMNNSSFFDGTDIQDHRSTGNIYFANSWPMTFSLPELSSGPYTEITTDRITLTFPNGKLAIPEILWRYTINGVPMGSIKNVTLRMTQDLQFSNTMTIPAGRIYTLDSRGSNTFNLSHAEGFDGALFSISGTLNLDNISIGTGEASKPLAALNGGTLTDSNDPDLTGYLHYTGSETGRAAGWQASYDQDGRMLSFASLGTFELTMPGIYAANALPVARSASIVKQFLLDPVSFTPISSPIFPNS